VPIADSVLNELAALDGGRFSVTNSVLQWAVIAALGPRSAIDILGSTINSQSIVAAKDAVIHIDSSDIFGSAVEARDDAVVLLTNSRLGQNVCHPLCLPLCPSFADGGCNWFLEAGAEMSLEAADRALIVAAGIDAPAGAIPIGASHAFIGDAFATVAPGATAGLEYDLRWRNASTGAAGVIATNGLGPKRGELLGTLRHGRPRGRRLLRDPRAAHRRCTRRHRRAALPLAMPERIGVEIHRSAFPERGR